MIFPRDVHSVVQNQRKLVGQNKTQLIVTIFVLGNIFGFMVLQRVLSVYVTNNVQAAFFVQLVILVVVGILVFRFGIFKEAEKKEEYKNANSDSFARYLYLRKDIQNHEEIGKHRINVFEYVNGTVACTFALRFGSTNNLKSENTRRMFEQILNRAAVNNFEVRVSDMAEDFSTSKEYTRHLAQINSIPDVTYRKHMMSITNCMMDASATESNVDIIYLTFRSVANYQKGDFNGLLREILSAFTSNVTSLRSIHSLDLNQLLDYYRDFYKIAAIDLTMMRAIEIAQDVDEEFSRIVKLVELASEDGRMFKTDKELDNLFSIPERSI